MSAFKAPLDPSTVLGGFSGNDYSGASAFIVTYPVNNAVDKEGNGTRKASAFKGAVSTTISSHLSSTSIFFSVLLGLSGVILVLLSVLGSVGLFSVLGVKSTLIIMEVIPFLVLAVSFA
ncbi:uncharacterized protein HKW66_Vig0148660 [Vigna angularis]|uniref:SSD domain-containing protein n=1 Tax=Phaseolus angularis TaxID=3914 RepID=A0A8T0JXL4_PHAAN|nr:uncharacterized protein HKW66_Vig0148660 [Vigna angularis]